MDPVALILIATLPVLLVCSGFFSGTETALFSLSAAQRARLRVSPALAAQLVTSLLAETRGLLITLLLGNMTVNVLYFVVSTVALLRLELSAVWTGVLSPVPLLAIILFGEVLPKVVAARRTEAWARVAAGPMMLVHRALTPVRVVAQHAVVTPLSRLIAPGVSDGGLGPDELELMLKLSAERERAVEPDEERLLQQVLELSQIKVRELLTPRVDLIAHDLAAPPRALYEAMRGARLSVMPVYRGTVDRVIGFVDARAVLVTPPVTRKDVNRLLQPPVFVPEQMRADRLLVELRAAHTTVAVVVDEYGGTAGVVALRDVIEHMVGELPGGETADDEAYALTALGVGRWRVGAGLPIHAWADTFGRKLGVTEAARMRAVSTVGGLVMAELGRVPRVGETLRLGNVVLEVETVNGHRPRTVLMSLALGDAGVIARDEPADEEYGGSS